MLYNFFQTKGIDAHGLNLQFFHGLIFILMGGLVLALLVAGAELVFKSLFDAWKTEVCLFCREC